MANQSFFTFLVFCLILIPTSDLTAFSSDTTDSIQTQSSKIDLYLDCDRCPRQYIKSNITFANYVRDRLDAEVQLIVTRARAGGGGLEYTLYFYGRKEFKAQNDTLTYFSPDTETQDIRRKGLVQHIKMGLMSYVISTPLVEQIDITYQKPGDGSDQKERDRWNKWMFELRSSLNANGRETRKSFRYYGSAEAERITKDWKTRFDLYTNMNWTRYIFDERPNRTDRQNSYGYHSIVAKSLTNHWSLGLYSNVNRSTYQNMDFSAGISPAVEYNIFPYEEHNTREISFRYRLTPKYNNYREETIFFKFEEYLVHQVGSMRIEYTQPWGEIDVTIRGSNYMHDFDKNRLSFNGSLELQLVKGLSFDLYGRYSIINDQISIPRGEATYEEVLLNLRQQATSYSFYGRVGFSYKFGAIYNNIVNPRF